MTETDKPNILIIYADQLRHDCIGALGSDIATPNIDQLISSGCVCTQACTPSPVCMPARWSLHTGQYTSSHKCYSNHHPGPMPDYSLPDLLRDAGYRTGLVGKNHSFLTEKDFDYFNTEPQARDRQAAHRRWLWARDLHSEYPRLCPEAAAGGVAGDPDHAKTDAALGFLEEQETKPFFLWLSYHHPHTPYYVPEPYYSLYADCDPMGQPQREGSLADKPFRQQFHQQNNDALLPFNDAEILHMRRMYAGMVTMLDAELGRVLDQLEQQGLRENTLIVLMSDHGDYMGDHGLLTKSPSLYDCLVRTPFIVSWPGVVPDGTASEELISHVDVMPTLLAAAGVPAPAAVEGINVLPFLCGDQSGLRPAVVSEYGIPGEAYTPERLRAEGLSAGAFHNPNDDRIPWEGNPVSLSGRIRMLRTKEWKLVEDGSGDHELYDLLNDPGELNNLFDDPGSLEIQQRLCQELQGWKATHQINDKEASSQLA